MNTIISFILVLGLLIFVHELGHFLFAKLFKVRVLKFSLGFGPKLIGKTIGETEYVISALPLGGYVKMFGENPDEQDVTEEDKKVSFSHKTVWQRFFIILAGPIFNLIFPIILFFGVYITAGVPEFQDTAMVGQVSEKSPAADAGIQRGDLVLEIDGNATLTWMDVLNNVKDSGGKELKFTLERNREIVEVNVTPVFDAVKNELNEVVIEKYLIGISPGGISYRSVGLAEAFSNACVRTWGIVEITGKVFVKIIKLDIPATELGGPILIAKLAGQQAKAGWVHLVFFTGLISINLGILNLLPIPILDGGHLFFLTIEGVRRKPMNERAQIIAQQIGLAILGSLMLFVFYNDIVRVTQ